jgi:phosphoglycolate phosphatase
MIVSAGEASFDVDAIVFDKDGTLMDLDAAWAPAAKQWVELAAAGDTGLQERLKLELGVAADGSLLDGGSMATEMMGQIASRTQAVLAEVVSEGEAILRVEEAALTIGELEIAVEPIGDVLGAMERLGDAGFVLAIASSDDTDQIFEDLAALGVVDLIAAVAGGDGPWDPKPDPGCLLALADGLSIDPGRMLMIGDSMTDVGAARAAGLPGVVGVSRADGTCSIAAMVDAVIASIDELLAT